MITREGTYYLLVMTFIVIGAMIRNFQLLMVLACMMVGPLLYNWRVVQGSLRRLKFSRKLSHSVCAGDPLLIELCVENSGRGSVYAVVACDVIEAVDGPKIGETRDVEVFFARVRNSTPETSTYRARVQHRGRYRLGPLEVSTAFPLGLIRNTLRLGDTDDLVVYPRIGRLTPIWRRMIQDDRSGYAASRRTHGMHEGDFYGLREWRTGDPKQWIHWRTTAKRNQLVVRQFEKQSEQDVTIIVDAWVSPRSTAAEEASVERIVSMAASVVADLSAVGGCQMYLACAGAKSKNLHGSVSQAFVHEAMTMLAEVTPATHDAIDRALLEALRVGRTGKVVILSSRKLELSDTNTFQQVWNDHTVRSEIGRVMYLSDARGELENLFIDGAQINAEKESS
ncbi:DUF58 domain-containing protein [Blastopirellula retiformator]|nr:DUF58 domain-containing protein [Blastopirellula retiformator]